MRWLTARFNRNSDFFGWSFLESSTAFCCDGVIEIRRLAEPLEATLQVITEVGEQYRLVGMAVTG